MNPKPKIKIGINGFGGIGRLVARAVLERDDMQVVAINDAFFHNEFYTPYSDFGLVHGKGSWKQHSFDVGNHGAKLFGEKKKYVKVYNQSDRALIPWAQVGAEYMVETSSEPIDQEKAYAHIKGGGAKVIIASYSEDAPMFVVGVNEHEYKTEIDIVSVGSRTTNCLAPLAKVVHNRFGIIEGIVEPHCPCIDQFYFYDIPFTGEQDVTQCNYKAAKAVERVIPALQEKLTGMNFYIPMANNVNVVEFIVVLEKATTLEQIKDVIREESQGELNGILGYIENDSDSRASDGDKRSCIFDANASDSLADNVVLLTARYNNEWGYSSRVVDMIAHMAKVCQGG